jgi:hypothetical protein
MAPLCPHAVRRADEVPRYLLVMPHVGPRAPGQYWVSGTKKHMPFLRFTTFDPIAEVGHRLRGTEYINMWPSHSLVLDGSSPADRPPLHVTNKDSPKVIAAALVAQLRAHQYRQLRIVF